MFEGRPLGMAGDLRLLPGRKLGIGVGQHLVRPGLKPLNFRVYIERALIGGLTQFRDAGLKRRYRLFEIEKTYHGPGVKAVRASGQRADDAHRSEEHTSELQSLMRISYAVFCLKKKNHNISQISIHTTHNTHCPQSKA